MAKSEVMIDNEKTRVTRWSFEPGEDTGNHVHEYDYVVVPMMVNLKLSTMMEKFLFQNFLRE